MGRENNLKKYDQERTGNCKENMRIFTNSECKDIEREVRLSTCSSSSESSTEGSPSSTYSGDYDNNSKQSSVSNSTSLHSTERHSSPTVSVYVNGLSRNVTKEHIIEIFSNFGKVRNIEIPKKSLQPECGYGIAYVEFYEQEGCKLAIRHMDGGLIDGNEVEVKPAKAQRGAVSPPKIHYYQNGFSESSGGRRSTSLRRRSQHRHFEPCFRCDHLERRRRSSTRRRYDSPNRRSRLPIRRSRSPINRSRLPLRLSRSPPRRIHSTRRSRSPIRRSYSPIRRPRQPTRRPRQPIRRQRPPKRRPHSSRRMPRSPKRRRRSSIRSLQSPVRVRRYSKSLDRLNN